MKISMKRFCLRTLSLLLMVAVLIPCICNIGASELATETEINEALLNELLQVDRFQFSLPDEGDKNLLTTPVVQKGVFSSLNNQTKMQVLYNEGGKIDMGDTAYLTYKLKNNSNQILSIGTMVYFRTTGGNLCAYVLNPLIYNAETGKKMACKTSYEYASGQYVLSNVMPTVEIPAGAEVFFAIPFISVNASKNYVPGIAMAEDDLFSEGKRPTMGNLWSNNADRTALLEDKLERDGATDCLQMQFFIGGNGANSAGIRTYDGSYDFEITELYAVSKQEYYTYASNPDNWETETETETEDKPLVGEDEDGMKYTTVSFTDNGLAITASFDVNGNILSLLYDRDRFDYVAKTFRENGFNRVYVVTTRGGIPAASSASNQWNDPGDTKFHLAESLIVSGNPNFEFLYACHKYGLEVIAVYKPYEGGGVSKGADADLSNSLYYEETVGGYWTGYDAFLSSHPEMRLSRKENAAEDAIVNDTITKIEAAFIVSDFTFHAWTGGLRQVTINSLNKTPIKLYVSKNNLDYEEYKGDYTLTFEQKKMTYLNENGWAIQKREVKCLVAVIEGIEIGAEYQYMALTMEDKTDRYIIPQSMINIYNAKGECLPATVGTSVRYKDGMTSRPADYIWGAEDIIRGTEKDALKYFGAWGFEFDLDGNGSNSDSAYINSYLFGIARGHFKYAKGTYCEAYPEVQEYWLEEVQNLLNIGYDGIEIRLQAHGSMYADYAYYGFNEPLMEAYIEKYGEDPREEEEVSKETAYRIACLRGEFFMEFMTKASKMTHDAGKTFGCQMRSAMLDTSMSVIMNTALHQMFCWAMPKIVIDWKAAVELCDTITIKQNWANNYRADAVLKLTNYAVNRGVQVWVTAYTQQYTNVDEYGVQIGEANVGFFNTVARDPNVYGIQMYEWDPTGSRFQHAFGIIKEKLNYGPKEEK